MIKKSFLLILLIALVFSCKKEEPGIYNSGRIDYRITYLNSEEEGYDPMMLPRRMVLRFDQDYCTNTIDGFFGAFRFANITDFKTRKCNTHLKVVEKNFVNYGKKGEMMCGFEPIENMKVEIDTFQKPIAGLKSYRAFISSTDNSFDEYEIFFTRDINIDRPNITNPYKEVDGVLTSFRMTMGRYEMQFTANKFESQENTPTNLKIPSKTKEVDRSKMTSLLMRLMQ